jgi:hypothetical protein
MPLEVISTTYLYQQQLSGSPRHLLKEKILKGDVVDRLSVKIESSCLSNVRANLHNERSRVDDANANLMSTLQDVQDIKVYRINREEFPSSSSLSAPSVTFTQNTPQPPTDTAFMIPKPLSSPLLRKANHTKAGRKLVGHQMLKQIQGKADLITEMERLRNESVSDDPSIKKIIASNAEIENTNKECRFLSHKGKLHFQENARKLENINILSKIRRDLIQQSENRRKDIQIYPDRFNTFHCKGRNDEQSVEWSLDSCRYHRNTDCDELFALKTNQEELIFSSSSSEDDGDKGRTGKMRKIGKRHPSLPTAENQRKQTFVSPRSQKFRERVEVTPSSPSDQRKMSEVTSTNGLISSVTDFSRVSEVPSSQGRTSFQKEQVDISTKLKNSLDQMDQALYRDLIRQQKLAQTKRNRTVQRSLPFSLCEETGRKDICPSSKSPSRIHSRKNTGTSATGPVVSIDITKLDVSMVMKDASTEEAYNLGLSKPGEIIEESQNSLFQDDEKHTELSNLPDDNIEDEDVANNDPVDMTSNDVVPLNHEEQSFVQNYSYRLRSFYQSIPNNPRGSIIYNKNNVTEELKEQVLLEKQRKMDIVEGIINEILQQRQSRWNKRFAVYLEKENKKDEEEENQSLLNHDSGEEFKESSKIYFVSPIGTVSR